MIGYPEHTWHDLNQFGGLDILDILNKPQVAGLKSGTQYMVSALFFPESELSIVLNPNKIPEREETTAAASEPFAAAVFEKHQN